MAFSPGMGLSLGHGDAVYVGLIMSILTGPTAFAVVVVARREAVELPCVNAMLFDTNPLLDAIVVVNDDDAEELMDGSAVICNLVAGT